MKRTIIRDCLRLAREKNAAHPEKFKHYTFIVQDNKVLEWGVNRFGDPLLSHGYPEYGKIHSENDAYRKAKGLLKDTVWEAINIRLSKKRELRTAIPCACCSAYFKTLGYSVVWASTADHGFVKVPL